MAQNHVSALASSKPPSRSPLIFVGKNAGGSWVVQDQAGLLGGLFISQAEAVRFAMSENGGQQQAIIMLTDTLELNLNCPARLAANEDTDASKASLKSNTGSEANELTVQIGTSRGISNV